MKYKRMYARLFCTAALLFAVSGVSGKSAEKSCEKSGAQAGSPTVVLYNKVLGDTGVYPELVAGDAAVRYTKDGLKVTGTQGVVRLDKYYALAQRAVRYHVKLSADAKAVFRSDKGDFQAFVDMPAKTVSMATNPVVWEKVDFLDPDHEYIVEIRRDYQNSGVKIIDLSTGQSAEIGATMNGPGGYASGEVCSTFFVGRQYDYYCFGLTGGTELLVKQICVVADRCDLALLLYGDSITEPEGYFPTSDFPNAWTQQIIRRVKGGAVSSGRGGTTINELLERIKNELPYVKAKYVMVTIGTNGGNTEENLGELVEYILSQGAVPILNNIPSNESGTQREVNVTIEKVRQKYGIKGCRFDWATSADGLGQQVDTTTMWREDYGKDRVIYHHPNVKGANRMYARTLIDVPEIYR